MEFEIEEDALLLDPSTNPSLVRRRRSTADRKARLHSWNRKPCQKAVIIPEEEEQLA
jgi:hypothetical protein